MKKFTHVVTLVLFLHMVGCKSDNYYFQEYLDTGENATLAMVDSADVKPGRNRAIIRFKVGIDARVETVKVSYGTTLDRQRSTVEIPITSANFGKAMEVPIENLTEAGFIVDIKSFRTLNGLRDSSKNTQLVNRIYGSKYESSLVNRIYISKTSLSGTNTLNFQAEIGLPQDKSIFAPMQSIEIEYMDPSGNKITEEFSPYENAIRIPRLANSGKFRFRTKYKPTEQAIDYFYTDYKEISY